MNIELFTLTSPIHNPSVVDRNTQEFLEAISKDAGCHFEMKGQHFEDYQTADLPLIYVRTGGTEAIFRQVEKLVDGKVRLLTSGKSNSLAASMEILSYLNRQGRKGEILHGCPSYIAGRIREEYVISQAKKALRGTRLGIIGQPSDWLIASGVDRTVVKEKLGIELVEIPITELVEMAQKANLSIPLVDDQLEERISAHFDRHATSGLVSYKENSMRIYRALDDLVRKYTLSGFTIRCFDLLSSMENTGCLALALFNSRGIPATCEGDIPSMLTMAIGNALTGFSGFQANPAQIDPEKNEMLLAHCTVPLNMVRNHVYDTHFESGIGLAVHGELPEGPATLVKFSGQLDRLYAKDVELLKNQYEKDLCRTQIVVKGENFSEYFLNNPIGNHHVVFSGHFARLFDSFFKSL